MEMFYTSYTCAAQSEPVASCVYLNSNQTKLKIQSFSVTELKTQSSSCSNSLNLGTECKNDEATFMRHLNENDLVDCIKS